MTGSSQFWTGPSFRAGLSDSRSEDDKDRIMDLFFDNALRNMEETPAEEDIGVIAVTFQKIND